MKKQMILWTCMLLLVLAGCKKDDVQYTDRYELKGKVEKGPFVRGSEVTVYELSERLNGPEQLYEDRTGRSGKFRFRYFGYPVSLCRNCGDRSFL